MRTKPAVIAALAALTLASAPIALAADPGFGPPSTGSDSGEAIRWLYWFVFAICAVVFVAVETALVLFVIRFRRRGPTPSDAEGPQIHGNTRVEIIWTIIPAVILAGIAIVVLARSSAVQATGGDRSDELVIRVEGHQFYWEYVYPDGQISLDTLVLPVDRPVTLELVSYDVIHSWWVPEITGKRDAIPGRTNTLSFTPNREGTFEGQCAELCGILHAVMPTTVDVVSEAEYADRLTLLTGQDQPGRHAARPRPGVVGARVRQVPRPCRRRRHRPADRQERDARGSGGAYPAADRGSGQAELRRLHAAGRPRLAGVPGAGVDRLHQLERAACRASAARAGR